MLKRNILNWINDQGTQDQLQVAKMAAGKNERQLIYCKHPNIPEKRQNLDFHLLLSLYSNSVYLHDDDWSEIWQFI